MLEPRQSEVDVVKAPTHIIIYVDRIDQRRSQSSYQNWSICSSFTIRLSLRVKTVRTGGASTVSGRRSCYVNGTLFLVLRGTVF